MDVMVVVTALVMILMVAYSFSQLRDTKKKRKEVEEEFERIRLEKERVEKELKTQEWIMDTRKIEIENSERELWKREEQKKMANEQLNSLNARVNASMRQVIEADKKIEELTRDQKRVAQERVEAEVNLLRTLKMGEYKRESEELEEQILDGYWRLSEELRPLREEVEAYREKRESIIEALKREREMEEQEEYFKIQLGEDAISDIGFINEILHKLHNKRVISEVVFKSYIQEPAKEMINRVVGLKQVTGIYRITDAKTQECYIGQGVNVGTRLMQHVKGSLGIQAIADQRVHRAMRDRGIENWTFELLEECEREELTEREKFYIAHYKSNEFGFNKRLG